MPSEVGSVPDAAPDAAAGLATAPDAASDAAYGVWRRLVGQENAIATLREAAQAARAHRDTPRAAMAHAWLITGPPGSGRSVAARAFAAALLCEGEQPGCGECGPCQQVLGGTHPDVTALATDKVHITIEQARELITIAQRAPSQGQWRVMIVEDTDRMIERTSNVLLKAIEEPPERTVWLMCAPAPHDVLITIRSRCRALHLRVPPPEDVAQLLIERDGVEPELARQCAREAQSHIGMAARFARDPASRERRRAILQSAAHIRGVGDAVLAAKNLIEVCQEEAAAACEELDAAERAELLRSLGEEEKRSYPPAVRSQIRQMEADQKRRATRLQRDLLDRAMTDLISLYRDVLVHHIDRGKQLINAGIAEVVADLAERYSPEQALRAIEAIGVARERLAANVAPLLACEAMMVAFRPQA